MHSFKYPSSFINENAVEKIKEQYSYLPALLLNQELNLPFISFVARDVDKSYETVFIGNGLPDGRVVDVAGTYKSQDELKSILAIKHSHLDDFLIQEEVNVPLKVQELFKKNDYEVLSVLEKNLLSKYRERVLKLLEMVVLKRLESRIIKNHIKYEVVMDKNREDKKLMLFIASKKTFVSDKLNFPFIVENLSYDSFLIATPFCCYIYHHRTSKLELIYDYKQKTIKVCIMLMERTVNKYELDEELMKLPMCLYKTYQFSDRGL